MRFFLSFCRVMVWTVLALTTLIQAGAIFSIYSGENLFNPTLLIVATVLMAVSVILFFALPRGKLAALLAATVAAVLFIIVALQLKDSLSVVVTTQGTAGISLWKAMYRHMSPALIPLFLLPLWSDYRAVRWAKSLAESDARTPTYFDTPDEDTTVTAHKPKRSVRDRQRKSEGAE